MEELEAKCKYAFYTCSFIGQVSFCNSCDGGQNYQMKQETRGGFRKGAGRKSIFKEPTKGVKFMCPVSKVDDLKKYVNSKFLKWSNNSQ